MNRLVNARRNIIWVVINKLVNIVLPFVVRTAFIYILGIKYLGLNGLFSSILGMLNLAELGVSSAITFSMYKPFSENDYEKLSAYLKLYKIAYRIIGIAVLVLGLCVMPFLPLVISGEVPSDINVYFLYLIYLINTCCSYLLFAYKSSLLVASQRNDVCVKINTIFLILTSAVQLLSISVTKNYYYYVIIIPIMTIANNVSVQFITKKMFPNIICKGEISKEEKNVIISKVKGLVWQKVGIVVSNSVDNIVISAFLGIELVAIYNNYYYIMSAVSGIFAAIIDALAPTVGNCLVTKSNKNNYDNFRTHNFIYMWMIIWACACFLCLYQPFMKLWLRDANLMLPLTSIILFVIYFFTFRMSNVSGLYKQAAGLWWEGKYVPIIAAVVNLVINLILVQYIGLNGILLSTIISMALVYFPYGSYVLFKHLFKYEHAWVKYMINQMVFFVETIFVCALTYIACSLISVEGFVGLGLRFIVCIIIPNLILVILNFKNPQFSSAYSLCKNMIKKK